jgi:hypothetical protein
MKFSMLGLIAHIARMTIALTVRKLMSCQQRAGNQWCQLLAEGGIVKSLNVVVQNVLN